MAVARQLRLEFRDALGQLPVPGLELVGAAAGRGEVGGDQRQDAAQACEAIDDLGVAGDRLMVVHAVLSASVGERRAARIAGRMPAMAPIRIAAPMPPPQASVGMTVVQCLVWA